MAWNLDSLLIKFFFLEIKKSCYQRLTHFLRKSQKIIRNNQKSMNCVDVQQNQ
jgi:hypothetical protein